MKKAIIVVLALVMVVSAAVLFVACGEKGEAVIKSYQLPLETKTYAVGDKYDSSDVVIVANLEDGTTRKVTKNLVLVGDDEESLKLEDGCFTQAGEYEVEVYALEEREDFLIGSWKIKVI